MKIKDILEDYSIHPNIPVKHLANDIEKVIGQFKNSLKVGICSPSQLIYSYCNYFDDIKKSFIRCVLNKEKVWYICVSTQWIFHCISHERKIRFSYIKDKSTNEI